MVRRHVGILIVELYVCLVIIFFFFKQKTAYEIYQCDWSSDVCSSDLALIAASKLSRKDAISPACSAERARSSSSAVESRDRKSVV